MHVGVFLVSPQWPGRSHTEALAETVRVALLAEELGFDDVWLAEHHFMSYGVCPSAIVLAGHLLGRTTRIGIGSAVSVLATTHPVALAEQAALLDHLGRGRLTLGVGRGGPWRELSVLGGGLPRWEHGFAADLDVLLSALRSPTVSARGPFLTFDEVPVVPRPLTSGGPPVRVAATTPATVRFAAERGLPLLLGMHAPDDEKATTLRAWESDALPGVSTAVPAGHVSVGIAHVGRSRGDAVRTVRAELRRWLVPGLAGYLRADGRERAPP